jgi:hypothetical protein
LGFAVAVSWALDGGKLYFDRFWDRPRSVYSIPALGGEPRLVLEDAFGASGGEVWPVATEGNVQPRRVAEGNGVSLDPTGRFLYISQTNKDPIALLRVPVAGGPAELIPVQGKFQMTNGLLSPAAVDAHGQILIEAASPNLFFTGPSSWTPPANRPHRST